MIDAVAGESHYRKHLIPVFNALPDSVRGIIYPTSTSHRITPQAEWVMVAGYKDLQKVRGHKAILVSHGAGQTYHGDRGPGYAPHPSYAGGGNHHNVRVFICPSQRVADEWKQAYPGVIAAAVGCPKLDLVHLSPPPKARTGFIGITFNWGSQVCPETNTGFHHYQPILKDLAAKYDVIGTAHPRMLPFVEQAYQQAGIYIEKDSEAVFAKVDCLIADNSSLAWEFMSLDKPVVWLNIPTYRRDIEHGMRFWSLADSGVQCDDPDDLLFAVDRALLDPATQQQKRADAIEQVYFACDGHATQRAVKAIMDFQP